MSGNLFLKLTGPDIQGESTHSDHRGEIEVLSWSHSFSPPAPSRGGRGEQAQQSSFFLTKYADSASDDLLKFHWSGKYIDKGVFSAYRPGADNVPRKFLEITMSDVTVSEVSAGEAVGGRPTETMALNYRGIDYRYIPSEP